MYLTYEEFKSYGGTLDEAAFNKYCFEAGKRIEHQTCGRASASEIVGRCCTKIVELLSASDPASTDRVSSFSHDGLSQSFELPSRAECNQNINDIICTYLMNETAEDGTPLLYKGVSQFE